MGKDDQSNQLNLTVVALVALVAIVGLVALVMNAATVSTTGIATGSSFVAADSSGMHEEGENAAGDAKKRVASAKIRQ